MLSVRVGKGSFTCWYLLLVSPGVGTSQRDLSSSIAEFTDILTGCGMRQKGHRGGSYRVF